MKIVVSKNGLRGGSYAEAYAGGAAVALGLLFEGYVKHIFINDLDRAIHAFWHSALYRTEELCTRVLDARVTMEEWDRQRAVQEAHDPTILDLGFSTFFLNRTNRSGIIRGGVVGGRAQSGKWKLDARFNRADLVDRIRRIGLHCSQISLTNLDAASFLTGMTDLPADCLLYLDPPYLQKGGELYPNHYQRKDHATIEKLLREVRQPWLVSYDRHPAILRLYRNYQALFYSLNYSAQDRYTGAEVIFFGPGVVAPVVADPVCIPRQMIAQLLESAGGGA